MLLSAVSTVSVAEHDFHNLYCFRMNLKHGSYEANPPFVPSMLTATANHIIKLLQQAEAAQQALSFVVLMPGWEEVKGWQMLRSSPFLTSSLLVAAADHGELGAW